MSCIHLFTHSADGRTQLVLDVDGPPLTSVYNAYSVKGPKQQAVKAEAKAWAQGLKEGVAAHLHLEAGVYNLLVH